MTSYCRVTPLPVRLMLEEGQLIAGVTSMSPSEEKLIEPRGMADRR
jgi:hypothetical protein